MKNHGKFHLSLRSRVILVIIFLQVAGIAIFAAYQVTHEYFALRARLEDAAMVSARCIGHSCMMPLLAGDRKLLNERLLMNRKEHGKEIQYILIHNPEGMVLGSIPADLAGVTMQDAITRKAISAFAPIIQKIPPSVEPLPLYRSSAFDVTIPLLNMEKKLGVLRLGVSERGIKDHMGEVVRKSLLMSSLAIAVGALLAFFVDRRLSLSFRELIRVSKKMAAGNLSERVDIQTGDDLEQLGESFNLMAEELGSAQAQLRNWVVELENKVRERTAELENEKQKLDGIVGGIKAGLVLLSRNMHILWTNDIIRQWFGPDREMIGRKCNGVIWGGDHICDPCPSRTVLTKGSSAQCEREYKDQNGRERYFQITSFPIKDDREEVSQVLELIQDITERKETEKKLLKTSKMAAIGEAASSIAHQLNNPMAIIGANAERIQEILSDGKWEGERTFQRISSYLEDIQTHIYRSRDTIEKVLRYTRMGGIDWRKADLDAVVEEAFALVKDAAMEKDVILVKEMAPDPPEFFSDPESLIQVFYNLLSNAIDASPKGGKVRLLAGEENNRMVVSIKDTGSGISKSEMGMIFEPFFTTKTGGKGTGIGLSFCVKILERLGGSLSVESALNKGAAFTVSLPLKVQSTSRSRSRNEV